MDASSNRAEIFQQSFNSWALSEGYNYTKSTSLINAIMNLGKNRFEENSITINLSDYPNLKVSDEMKQAARSNFEASRIVANSKSIEDVVKEWSSYNSGENNNIALLRALISAGYSKSDVKKFLKLVGKEKDLHYFYQMDRRKAGLKDLTSLGQLFQKTYGALPEDILIAEAPRIPTRPSVNSSNAPSQERSQVENERSDPSKVDTIEDNWVSIDSRADIPTATAPKRPAKPAKPSNRIEQSDQPKVDIEEEWTLIDRVDISEEEQILNNRSQIFQKSFYDWVLSEGGRYTRSSSLLDTITELGKKDFENGWTTINFWVRPELKVSDEMKQATQCNFEASRIVANSKNIEDVAKEWSLDTNREDHNIALLRALISAGYSKSDVKKFLKLVGKENDLHYFYQIDKLTSLGKLFQKTYGAFPKDILTAKAPKRSDFKDLK